MIEQTYKLSMIPFEEQVRRNYEIPIVPASQYDKTLRTLSFELYNGEDRFTIPAEAVVYIFGMKPDGNAFQYQMTVEDNMAKIAMQTQMTTVAGCVTCEIVLFEENTSGPRIGSANFKLMVEKCAVGDDAEFSRSDMPVIQTLIFGGTTGDILVKDVNGVTWSSEAPSEGYMRYAQYDPEITGTVNSARDSETVDGHTVARNVLANEYTNEQIDQKIAEGGGGGNAVWGRISGDIANQADLQRELSNKVTKVAGKGLSTNDFTDQWRNKLEGIAAGAEVNVQANWDQTVTTADDFIQNKPTIPENTSDLVNDSGFITAALAPVQGVKGSAESAYRTGNVSISKANIGLDNVDNTSDADKPISTAVQNALSALNSNLSQKVSSVNGETPDTNGNVEIDATDIEISSGVAIKSVNGNPVTITDALQGNALGVNTTLEPIQDLHGYDHPWAGGAGKNLANLSEVTGGTVTGESVTVQGGTASYQAAYILMNLKGGTTYTFSARATRVDDIARISFRNVNNNQNVAVSEMVTSAGNLSVSYTPSIDEDKRLSLFCTYGTANPDVATVYEDIQIEESSEPTAYEPYSNICPISGRTQVDVLRTGKNIIPFPYSDGSGSAYGLTRTVSDDGKITITGTTTRGTNFFLARSIKLKAGTYTLSISGVHEGMLLIARNIDTSTNLLTIEDSSSSISASFTTETDISQFNLYFNVSYADKAVDISAYVQLELGSIATEYESYTGQSVTVQLGQTVYGGTLNVTTGLLTMDRGFFTASADGSWRFGGTTYKYVYKNDLTTGSSIEKLKCNIAPTVTGDANFGVTRVASGRLLFWCNALNIESLKDWNNYITNNNVQFVYELSTPQTIQLTPAQIQLLTTTNIISTNADDLSVRYYATGQTGNVEGNIAFLLDKTASNETAINTVSESIAPTETGTATQNYATGSYLMLNNRLCKVTAAIATGEQIIVGTNVQYTTIADELLAIFSQLNA